MPVVADRAGGAELAGLGDWLAVKQAVQSITTHATTPHRREIMGKWNRVPGMLPYEYVRVKPGLKNVERAFVRFYFA